MMTLYYAPGACSLAAHIVLRELGRPFQRVAVSLKRKTTADGGEFLAVNPKGYVPALRLEDGAVLTEGPAILQYLADLDPGRGLAPAPGTFARVRLQEWLAFINSELHKSFGPLFDPAAPEATQARARALIARRFDYVAGALHGPTLQEGGFSVADAYLYTVLTWTRHVGPALEGWPALADYLARHGARDSVRAAHAAEKARG